MTTGNSFLDADLARIRANLEVALLQPKPIVMMQCLFPPKPWGIHAKENARHYAFQARAHRNSWFYQNRAENWLREALRMHRFSRGTSVVQTFGVVL